MSDPGKLALAGFSAGNPQHPFFNTAKNLLKSSYTQADLDSFDHCDPIMDRYPEFLNSGLALQFSARLTKAWESYRKGRANRQRGD